MRLTAWNESTRRQILANSVEPFDSSSKELYNNGSIHVIRFFKNDRLAVAKTFSITGEQTSQTIYANDSLFKIKWEMCKNNQVNDERIFYKDDIYGLSTKWRCDSSIEEEGFTFKNEKFGVWHSWDEKGKIITTDHKKYNLADSLELINVVSN